MTVAVADSKPSPVDDSYLDNIENMVADREVNDDVVEHLLSERLLEGFLLLERACPACTTPLVKQPLDSNNNDDASKQPWSPTDSKNAIAILQNMHSQESPMSCLTPQRAPAPIPGVPFCVNCKSHVVTHESEIKYLDTEHNTMKHQGKMLFDLLPQPSPRSEMYETTTITSTSTQFQPAALRQRNRIGGDSNHVSSPRNARTTASGLLTRTTTKSGKANIKALDEESVVPVPDDENDSEEEEREVSIALSPISMTPLPSSPAASTLLYMAVSEDQVPQQHGEKKKVDDHEDDALIEIYDEDDENCETFEVIHISEDKDVVEEGRRVEYTRKTTEMIEHHQKLVIEQTVPEKIPGASTERTSATTDNNETAGERDDVLPEYSVR
jgi:hypothetical protein